MSDDVENELFRDRMIYGTSYHYLRDGKKVRVPPQEVFYKPRGWYFRLLWDRLCRWVKSFW